MTINRPEIKRGVRFEILTVTSVAFLSAIAGSIAFLLKGSEAGRFQLSWSHGTAIYHMAMALLVLAMVWYQRGGSLRSLGIRWDYRVLPAAALLCFAYWSLELIIYAGARAMLTEAETGEARRASQALGSTPPVVAALFVVFSAAREELVGRAYLIARLEQLGWKSSSAVVCSAVLLGACHLYQGIPAALGHMPAFILGSAYYVRYRNSVVLVLAHIAYNVGALWVWGGG